VKIVFIVIFYLYKCKKKWQISFIFLQGRHVGLAGQTRWSALTILGRHFFGAFASVQGIPVGSGHALNLHDYHCIFGGRVSANGGFIETKVYKRFPILGLGIE
jgi:hypothetical protein